MLACLLLSAGAGRAAGPTPPAVVCHVHGVKSGLWCTRNTNGNVRRMFFTDNLLKGTHTWDAAQKGASVAEDRGVQITGTGCVVAYNRVRGFKDGIDTFPSRECSAIDVHDNDISECLDDGFRGKAPDLGAIEQGDELPQYGPRPER